MTLLLANAIRVRETPANFLGAGAIWVEEEDYSRAAEIASSLSQRHSKLARHQWAKRWSEVYKGSYRVWLAEKLSRPGGLIQLLILALMLGLFVVYPVAYFVGYLAR